MLSFVRAVLLEPLREVTKYIALLLVMLGCALILLNVALGGLLGELLHSSADQASKAVSNVGSAILGAGVFAVIMKSAQFTTLFQERIMEVFNQPVDTFGLPSVKDRWKGLTDSILGKTLPNSHAADASSRIRDQFLNEELQYHFENYNVRYDIEVENGTAVIRHLVQANLVISPLHQAPVFTQEMRIDGAYELLEVRINGDPVEHQQFLKKAPSGLWTFTLPLKGFLTGSRAAADRSVGFERSYRITQNVAREPYIMATIKRYTKGLTVCARISPGYDLFFATTGLDQNEELSEVAGSRDAEEFTRWRLARLDELLLPGQGFVLIIRPQA